MRAVFLSEEAARIKLKPSKNFQNFARTSGALLRELHLIFMGCQQRREKNGRPGRKKGPTHFVLRAEPNFG